MHINTRAYSDYFCGGEFRPASSDRAVDVVSPHSGLAIATVSLVSEADVDNVVSAARRAFDVGPWPRMAPAERARHLRRFAEALELRVTEIAELAIEEQGTPAKFGFIAEGAASYLRMYADLAETYPFEEKSSLGVFETLTVREPVGVTVAIPAYNSPLLLALQKIAPALAAGCTVIVKAPEQDPISCLLLAEAARQASLPEGTVNVLVADAAESEYLVGHPDVDMVSFTGSTAVGSRIGAICGRDIRRMALELGGKSAAIVLDDADFSSVVPALVGCSVGLLNGEMCTMQSRIVVPRSRYDEFVTLFVSAVECLTVGDPADASTDIGPMISSRHRDRVEGYIALGVREGAVIVTGGSRPVDLTSGWYVQPTVLASVTRKMRIAQEEIFGPVVCLIAHDGVDDAIAIANDSEFGLSGTVWTADVEKGLEIARRVRTGTFSVNGYIVNPMAPFGGFKRSGIGREMGKEAIDEYIEFKSICLSGPAFGQ
jgi:aldehyde dehydrogenase (NAD+)